MDTFNGETAAGAEKDGVSSGTKGSEMGEDSTVGSPSRSLKIHATLFGSTLSKLFTALDGVALGEVVAITTNDP